MKAQLSGPLKRNLIMIAHYHILLIQKVNLNTDIRILASFMIQSLVKTYLKKVKQKRERDSSLRGDLRLGQVE